MEEPVFSRAFRWILSPKDTKFDVSRWCLKVDVDYIWRHVMADFIDDAKGEVFAWLESIRDPNIKLDLVLTHYDQHGRQSNNIEFTGCELVGHNMNYNYGNAEPLLNVVKFGFKKVERKNGLYLQ